MHLGRFLLVVCLCGAFVVSPQVVIAQERLSEPAPGLRLPLAAFGAAAMADWATTYHALKNYHVREANPLLRPLDHEPAQMVGLGAAMDVGIAAGWYYGVGRKHPRIGAVGLWAATVFRTYLAIHNLRNERRSVRR